MPARDKHFNVLSAFTSDVRVIAGLLRGICLNSSSQRALMTINTTGIQVAVQEARTLSAMIWLKSDLFDEFTFEPELLGSDHDEDGELSIAFSFQLHTLLECMNIFGTATGSTTTQKSSRTTWKHVDEENDEDDQAAGANGNTNARVRDRGAGNERIASFFRRADGKGTGLRLSYAGEGSKLILMLAESASGPSTKCELATFEAEDWLEVRLGSDLSLRCILKSSWLRDALQEVDQSCDKITFIGNPALTQAEKQRSGAPQLRIRTVGPFGSAEMDFPNDKEVLETFECESSVSFSYRFPLIAKSIRALQNSSKASIRINAEGVLGLQFLTNTPSGKGTSIGTIVEFKCLSIDESI